MNPFLFSEPAVISFSGGRTSAFMLYNILDAYGGALPDYIKVVFANTGKEMPQTLDFVADCADAWGVDIAWIECRARPGGDGENKYIYETVEVDYLTASRNGEPFESLIIARNYLPNVVARFCTQELKVLRIRDWMNARFSDWVNVIGIRADESRRAVKLRNDKNILPLVDAGITAKDVSEFWLLQPFDLSLPNNNGVTDWGNCDLCYLKGFSKKLSIVESRPGLADWWAGMEEKIGGVFRADQPDYASMKVFASDQGRLFDNDDSIPCFCGD